jgi:hypothetical protein
MRAGIVSKGTMKRFLFLLLASFLLISCGGRVPSPQTAQGIMKDYFKGYGKKYPTTPFGTQPIDKIEILHTEELQKAIATSQALLTFKDGSQMKIQMNFHRKTPLGWRATGWEDLEAAPIAPSKISHLQPFPVPSQIDFTVFIRTKKSGADRFIAADHLLTGKSKAVVPAHPDETHPGANRIHPFLGAGGVATVMGDLHHEGRSDFSIFQQILFPFPLQISGQ